MKFKTLIVCDLGPYLKLTLNRPQQQNSINMQLLEELNLAFDEAEKNKHCRMIILEGNAEVFCSGMDLREIALLDNPNLIRLWASLFMKTMKRFTTTSKVIISHIDGKALGGGIGLAAASDWVIATERAHFKLTEAFWGLIPAMIAPYLIRRIGIQPAYNMALTSRGISAQEAKNIGFVDELTADLEEATSKLLQRLSRSTEETTGHLKSYFCNMWVITEAMEEAAIDETIQRLRNPKVRADIRAFVENGVLPYLQRMKAEG